MFSIGIECFPTLRYCKVKHTVHTIYVPRLTYILHSMPIMLVLGIHHATLDIRIIPNVIQKLITLKTKHCL